MTRQILFLDDELESRFVVADYLRSLGYGIITVARSADALRVAGEVALDAIILDVNLIDENGRELMPLLTQNHPAVPIILYSGMDAADPRVVGMLANGAREFVGKNGPLEHLVMALRRVMS